MMDQTDERTSELADSLAEFREDLTEELRIKLIESGWRDKVATLCRRVIEEKGVESVKMSDILNEVRAEAKSAVPHNIKTEMLAKIRKLHTAPETTKKE